MSSSASRSRGRSPRAIPTLLADEPTGELDFRTGDPDPRAAARAGAHRPGRGRRDAQPRDRARRRPRDRALERTRGARGSARGRPGRDRRPALVSDGPPAASAAVDPLGAAGRAPAPSAGAVDRAAAGARRRHVRRHEQHVGLARRLGRRQLRCAAHARPARLAGRGKHRAPEGALRSALARTDAGADVAAAAERLVSRRRSTRQAVGARSSCRAGSSARRPARTCDTLDIRAGRAPTGGSTVALEHNFARHYDLPASGSADARRRATRPLYRPGARARVLHRHRSRAPTSAPRRRSRSCSRRCATAQALAGAPGRVNAAGRAPPARRGCGRRAGAARALRWSEACPDTGFTFTGRDQEPAHRLIYKDAEGDQEMLDIFAFLLLGAAALRRLQPDQPHRRGAATRDRHRHGARRRAVGARAGARSCSAARSRWPASRSGSPSGWPPTPGWPASWTQFFPLPVVRAGFQSDVYRAGAALGVALPLLAAAVPVWRALRVTPIEAIRVGARAARSSGLAWLAKGMRLPGGSLANLPLRNVLRTPRRTDDDPARHRRRSSRSSSPLRA